MNTSYEKILKLYSDFNVAPLFESNYILDQLGLGVGTSTRLSASVVQSDMVSLRFCLAMIEYGLSEENFHLFVPMVKKLPLFIDLNVANDWRQQSLKYMNGVSDSEKEKLIAKFDSASGNKKYWFLRYDHHLDVFWENFILDLGVDGLKEMLNTSLAVFSEIIKDNDLCESNCILENVNYIAKNIEITDEQSNAWGLWLTLCANTRAVESVINSLWFVNYWENNLAMLMTLFDRAFVVSSGTSESVLCGTNPINSIGLGWVDMPYDRYDFSIGGAATEFISEFTPRNVMKIMTRKYKSPDDLLAKFVSIANDPDSGLTKDSFNHVKYDLENIITAIKNDKPVKILVWGNPGSGKTQMSKLAIYLAKKTCISEPEMDEYTVTDRQNDYGQSRLNNVKSSVKMAQSLGSPVILVDECEVVLTSQEHKSSVTEFLDQKNIHQVWIANSLNGIHEAYIRRFDVVIHLPDMPLEHREKLALSLFNDADLSQKIAQSMRTPAEIVSAWSWCHQIGSFKWSDIVQKIAGYQRAVVASKNEKDLKEAIIVVPPNIQKENGIVNIAGYSYIKKEAEDIIYAFNYPDRFRKMGAKIPKGVLLSGSPGSGKTLFARCIANEVGVPLIMASASSLAETPEKIGVLFQEARKHAPCIIFIDEIDVVASNVETSTGDTSLDKQKILNRLLVEIDGFENLNGVMIIGATHRGSEIDRTITRSGRLSRSIYFREPDKKDRIELFKYYLSKVKTEMDIDLPLLARATRGMSCADIPEIVNIAAQKATKDNLDSVPMDYLVSASNYVFWGGDIDLNVSSKELEKIAYHEASHAVVAKCLGRSVERVTVRPRPDSFGITNIQSSEKAFAKTYGDYLDDCKIFLAGPIAEQIFFKHHSEGASSDLSNAHSVIRQCLTGHGFGQLGLMVIPGKAINTERIIDNIDTQEYKIIKQQSKNTAKIIKTHKKTIAHIANKLIKHKELSNKKLHNLLNKIKIK